MAEKILSRPKLAPPQFPKVRAFPHLPKANPSASSGKLEIWKNWRLRNSISLRKEIFSIMPSVQNSSGPRVVIFLQPSGNQIRGWISGLGSRSLGSPFPRPAWSVNLSIDQAVYGKASETLENSSLSVDARIGSLGKRTAFPVGSSWHDFGGFGRLDLRKDEPTANSSVQKTRGRFLALSFLGAGIWLGCPKDEDDSGLRWEEWSPERQESLLAEGRGVYVDYTAKWCQSCQFNKRVYESAEVIDQFNELDAVPLKADWTKRRATHTQVS